MLLSAYSCAFWFGGWWDVDLFVGWYMTGGCGWLLDLRFEVGVWFQYFFCCMWSLALQLMYALWRCGVLV